MAEVRLEAVSFVFPGGVRAVDGVSLLVAAGECLAVLGPSGCGKTTLLRLVAGLEEPTAGEVRVGGRVVSWVRPEDRDVGLVPQVPAVYPHLTARENLGFGLRFRAVAKDEAQRRVNEVAAALGLTELLGRLPHQLSGGERQRVALGRALVRRPAVLLLDEPLAHLDVPRRAAVRDEVIRLRKHFGMTALWVTHDPAEAAAAGDRVAEMDAGKLLRVHPPGPPTSSPAPSNSPR
jgi:multiple sugar transport system ATP-binding protein